MAHLLSSAYLFYLAFVPISLGAALILASNPTPGLWWVTALGINWTLGALSLLPAARARPGVRRPVDRRGAARHGSRGAAGGACG